MLQEDISILTSNNKPLLTVRQRAIKILTRLYHPGPLLHNTLLINPFQRSSSNQPPSTKLYKKVCCFQFWVYVLK